MKEQNKKIRAGHKEGSVFYDSERDRWVAEVTVETGKRKRFRFKTKQEAIRKRNEALRELDRAFWQQGHGEGSESI